MRHRYLSKLTYQKVWQQGKPGVGTQKSISMIIFDWDDTFFPTSAYNPRTEEEMQFIAENNVELFRELD